MSSRSRSILIHCRCAYSTEQNHHMLSKYSNVHGVGCNIARTTLKDLPSQMTTKNATVSKRKEMLVTFILNPIAVQCCVDNVEPSTVSSLQIQMNQFSWICEFYECISCDLGGELKPSTFPTVVQPLRRCGLQIVIKALKLVERSILIWQMR